MGATGSDGGYGSAAKCISAGMYWFGQSDLSAAEAWWRRALELEPDNPKAKECLRLLQRSSSTGYKSDSWARLPAVERSEGVQDVFSSPPAPAEDRPLTTADLDTGSIDLPDEVLEDAVGSQDLDPHAFGGLEVAQGAEAKGSIDLYAGGSGYAPVTDVGPSSGATGLGAFIAGARADAQVPSPWDDGPSRTSVITVDAEGDFDAVPEATPLPEIDRERFFNRGDPSSIEEIKSFLTQTGDLPPEDAEPPLGVMSDDLGPIGMVQDGIATEPVAAVRAESVDPLKAAREQYQLHDFQGVLDTLQDYEPSEDDQTEVRNMMAESRANLLRMYEAKIGNLEQIPVVRVTNEEVIWLNLNHRAGFILSQVDGAVSYEDLISLSGMPRLDTVRILTELLDQNVIGV